MTTKNKGLGDGEKTVIVGVLVLGFWLGIDAIARRAEKTSQSKAQLQRTTAGRRLRVVLFRRRQEAA